MAGALLSGWWVRAVFFQLTKSVTVVYGGLSEGCITPFGGLSTTVLTLQLSIYRGRPKRELELGVRNGECAAF